ncbi:RtcB family protein [Desulfoluna spongiiphila]|uniref:RtcB family protein n=1 Tax=Desulfoluna spongiiphila TaxID=419481 RepID=UPI00125BA7F8|nr:RtcB family protein [Desulfoluna spongiiphila]VVS91007.1 trna-splicing ligase rtcb [Desulfoluna spongiiphila]
MPWEQPADKAPLPIKSWCTDLDEGAMRQARNLQQHPVLVGHVALMPDCHLGYGMPIGGVVAADHAIIPNAVGVDIGCGMMALQTDLASDALSRDDLRRLLTQVKERVPLGFSRHKKEQSWDGFSRQRPRFIKDGAWKTARESLGSLGGGNHFIEVQKGDDGSLWLMIHTGSRNLGKTIAEYHHKKALAWCRKHGVPLPDDDLAFFPTETPEGMAYIEDMNLALAYAMENRRRIMTALAHSLESLCPFSQKRLVNIHHNYASLEAHDGKQVWVHRKGATSAARGEAGIIPGSMGTPSYIVEGLGNPESFRSCSHGAGRAMGRNQASRILDPEHCTAAMGDVVFDRWHTIRHGKLKGRPDLGEAPQAYKAIEAVMAAQADLTRPVVRLFPLGVVKG